MTILGNNDKAGTVGTHFTDSQEKGTTFRNVSDTWLQQCVTFDEGLQKLAESQAKIKDHLEPLSAFRPVVDSGNQFALQYRKTGQTFRPTEHALKNIAVVGETSDWMLGDLATDKPGTAKKHGDVKFKRDRSDAELMVHIVGHTLFNPTRMDQEKTRLFRTWDDGTLRALLSNQYAIVNNEWYLEVLKKLIPGGILSHWRGDADTIFGNVLIPDTIRQESDSAYGGMLSVGNSEIGLRRIMSMPSVFRSICMNGCIWEQEKGSAIRKKHRGQIDLEALENSIRQNLERQIPLLNSGIDKMLSLRQRVFGAVAVPQMLAATARMFKISKKNMVGVRKAFDTEAGILGGTVKSAFGLAGALTRHGQPGSDQEWVDFDQKAGEITQQTDKKWESLQALGQSISDPDDIKKLIGNF